MTRSHNTRSFYLGKPEVSRVFTQQDVARFWAKVDRDGPVPAHNPAIGPCWQWTSSRSGSLGYGQFGVRKAGAEKGQLTYYAHRVAWELSHGALPYGQQIRHHCDNPICVNVAHLALGTHKNNMGDAQARGRLHTPRPSKQTVTDAQLLELLNLARVGMPQVEIARRLGVTKAYVSLVLKGKRRQYSLPQIAALRRKAG